MKEKTKEQWNDFSRVFVVVAFPLWAKSHAPDQLCDRHRGIVSRRPIWTDKIMPSLILKIELKTLLSPCRSGSSNIWQSRLLCAHVGADMILALFPSYGTENNNRWAKCTLEKFMKHLRHSLRFDWCAERQGVQYRACIRCLYAEWCRVLKNCSTFEYTELTWVGIFGTRIFDRKH